MKRGKNGHYQGCPVPAEMRNPPMMRRFGVKCTCHFYDPVEIDEELAEEVRRRVKAAKEKKR